MSETTNKREKQKRNLSKIVGKLYKNDLIDICKEFSLSKGGNKCDLKTRIVDLIESDKPDIDFPKLRKKIRRVYKLNDKIKKSPKKGKDNGKKKTKKTSSAKKTPKNDNKLQNFLANCVVGSPTSSEDSNTGVIPLGPAIPVQRQSYESSNDSFSESDSELWAPEPNPVSDRQTQPIALPFPTFSQQTIHNSMTSSSVAPPQTQSQPPQPVPSHPYPLRTVQPNPSVNPLRNFLNLNNWFSRYPTARPPVPIQPQTHNSVNNRFQNPPGLQPLSNYNQQNNNYNSLSHPLDYSVNNNYYPTSGPPNPFHQNCYPTPAPDVLNPTNFGSLVEQQKILLSQFPNSFQDNDRESSESSAISEVPVIEEFTFKCLPKFKAMKILSQTKTIGSLSDIGYEIEFNVNIWDLDPSYSTNYQIYTNLNERFKSMLERKELRILLRFSYVADVLTKEQKDLIPEFLCIECNGLRVFTYEQNESGTTGPFDLSDYCNFNKNRVKFSVSKPNYTFLMPCIYEVSLVEAFTPDKYYEQLKNNIHQLLSSESTKQMIKSRNEQSVNDDNITIVCNTDTKLKLICPLSCKRIGLPIRTVDCKHIECFDAYSFLQTNESRYDWICPICQKSAHFDKLRIDGYLKEVLNETQNTVNEIFIKPDATYSLKQSQNNSDSEELIELDDSTLDSDDVCEVSVIDSDGCIVLD